MRVWTVIQPEGPDDETDPATEPPLEEEEAVVDPEAKWSKARWKQEALQLRLDLEAVLIQRDAAMAGSVTVDDVAAAATIDQLKRDLHNARSGQDGRRVARVRAVIAATDEPTGYTRALLEALR